MNFHRRKSYKIKYSQNFLRDQAAVSLVNRMNLNPKDVVVEIGPGTGQLTKLLLQRVRFVLAVEKDPLLANKLSKDLSNYQNFLCINADFLTWELPLTNFKLVGNIPFAHTNEIVRKLVNHQSPPKESYLIMQAEASQKFTGNPRETLFSLQHKAIFEIQVKQKISRDAFTPQPNVDAALLSIKRRVKPLVPPQRQQSYFKFIEKIYEGYQQDAYSALKSFLSKEQLQRISNRLTINLRKRRSDITCEEWVQIFSLI